MTNADQLKETILAIDFGETNIGTALGRNGLVLPLTIISAKNLDSAINEIAKHVFQNKVSTIIVGLPLTFNGKDTMESLKVRQFTKQLRVRLKKPIIYINEFGSSKRALTEALQTGVSQKGREKTDHLSAAIILRDYYESLNAQTA